MRFVTLLLALPLWFSAGVCAQLKPVLPQHVPSASGALGSPGIDAGDYVYVSGQGPRRPDGSTPANFADQVRQSLENVRSVVEAAGLTMDHLVYVQVYLDNMSNYEALNSAFADYFPKTPPARALLGVARLPEPPLQITAVAVRDLNGKHPTSSLARRTQPEC
jgi:2-iminobutanoate/2-iminopropanoate deaminase